MGATLAPGVMPAAIDRIMKPALRHAPKQVLLLLAAVILLTSSCQLNEVAPTTNPTETLFPGQTEAITVYFTDPTDPAASSYRGGVDEILAAAIDQAQAAVDLAVYDLNLWCLRDALIAAHQRGVTVRMVTESDNLDEPEMQQLREAGIEVLGDRREGLMHNKFVIIDRWEVWTGSTNFTTSGVYRNDNNLVRIRSSRLAQDYTAEFEEMFLDDAFGPGSPANTPYPQLTVDGVPLEVYFSPDDGVLNHILTLVGSAQQSVYFMAYSFTADELAEVLLARAAAGVEVKGVFEADQYSANIGTEFDHLLDGGLAVRLDGNPDHMHHKVILIDGQIVITGSYNFSANAEETNDENLLVIHSPDVAALFLVEFQRVYNLAQP
jgi:phosphatidylserine/phosphatidylglycerophosphate/cardiolipin synthase-like enzyme